MSEAFYGILFVGNEEAAFSNFRLFEASGSVITYMLSPMFCTHTKLIILIVLMSVGIVGYSIDWLDQRALILIAFFLDRYGIVEFSSNKEMHRDSNIEHSNKIYRKASVDTRL